MIDTTAPGGKSTKRVTILLKWGNEWVIIGPDDVDRFVTDFKEEQKDFPKDDPFMVGQPLSAYLHRETSTRATPNWNLIQAPKKWISALRKAFAHR